MSNNTQATVQRVINAICQAFGVSEEQLSSRTRVREIVSARHMFYKIGRDTLGMTYKTLGSTLTMGRKGYDHSTVMHAIEAINDLMSIKDEIVTSKYNEVMSIIRQKSDRVTTVHIKVWPDQANLLFRFLQREEISFTVLDSVISQETKTETNGTE